MSEPLLIVGASVRSAAMSAQRAGFRPLAIDQFADTDLQEIAATSRSVDYPRDLLALAESLPPAPWMYTGALENHPALIDALAQRRPLWGNDAGVLRRVRDPFWLAECLATHRLPAAPCRPATAEPFARHLVKPFASGCGLGIRFDDPQRPACAESEYLQEWIPGVPCSALYVADGKSAQLIGVSRQLIGMPSQPVSPFAFCGAISPWPVSDAVLATFRQIGTVLARDGGLCGLFGCDAILNSDGPYVVELNPRYTASVELFERCGAGPLIRVHAEACQGRIGNLPTRMSGHSLKLILYARESFSAPNLAPVAVRWNRHPFPRLADLPAIGTQIEQGSPICTLLGAGSSIKDAVEDLETLLADVAARLPETALEIDSLSGDLSIVC